MGPRVKTKKDKTGYVGRAEKNRVLPPGHQQRGSGRFPTKKMCEPRGGNRERLPLQGVETEKKQKKKGLRN